MLIMTSTALKPLTASLGLLTASLLLSSCGNSQVMQEQTVPPRRK